MATTHVLLVIDKSGSMTPLAADVRGGYNAALDTWAADAAQSDKNINYRITAVLFDTRVTWLCTDVAVADAPRLNHHNYMPSGYTALLDAVGGAIRAFESANPDLPEDDRIILTIHTDGEENSSREYTWGYVAAMIDERDKSGRWVINYIGAGPDAWAQGRRFGDSTQVIMTGNTSDDITRTYTGLANATTAYARGADTAAVVGHITDATGTAAGGGADD